MGLDRYLSAEEFEKEISDFSSNDNQKYQHLFILCFGFSFLIICLLIVLNF